MWFSKARLVVESPPPPQPGRARSEWLHTQAPLPAACAATVLVGFGGGAVDQLCAREPSDTRGSEQVLNRVVAVESSENSTSLSSLLRKASRAVACLGQTQRLRAAAIESPS